MQVTKLIILTVLATSLGTAARSQTAPPHPQLLTVTGDGEARIAPDLATVRVGIQAQAKTAQDAQAQANATMQKIIAATSKAGIDRKEIQTGTLSLYPVFSEQKPGQATAPTIVAYHAQNTLTVRVVDLTKTGGVVDASVAAGANEIQGIEFSLQDDTAAKQDAIKNAVKAARAKADAMASALGVKLGGIYEVSEGGAQVVPMPMARMAMADTNTPVAPGQVAVTATITIRYFILQ